VHIFRFIRLKDKSVYRSIVGGLNWSYLALSIILHSVLLRNKAQTKRRLNKSPNQKQELPMAAMFVNGSGQNEQSLEDLP
jgi:uncharacterized alpha/beta hydrolase family protein